MGEQPKGDEDPASCAVSNEMLDAGEDCFLDIPYGIEMASREQMRCALKRAFIRMLEVQKKARQKP